MLKIRKVLNNTSEWIEILFSALLQEIASLVEKQNTNYRTAISAAERLSMTLR